MPASSKTVNYYEILEVSSNASHAVIRAAYKILMQRYHPDKNSGDQEMERQTILIGQAFDVLSDSNKRKAYDLELELEQQKLNDSTFAKTPHTVTSQQNNQQPADRVINPISHDPSKPRNPRWVHVVVGSILLLITIGIIKSPSSEDQTSGLAERSNLRIYTARELEMQTAEAKRQIMEGKEAEAKSKEAEAKSKIARTIPQLVVDITVKMPPSQHGDDFCSDYSICTHYIKIPIVGVIVHENGSEEMIQHIQKNRSLIVEGIRIALSKHLYTDLTQVYGEEKLRILLRDQINRTVVGDFSQNRGVKEVLLPKSFSLH